MSMGGANSQVTLSGTSDVNLKQVNGQTVDVGNGTVGVGTQRVAIGSDNTAFAIKIDQTTPGTTNNVEITGHGGVQVKDDTAFGDGVTTGILSVTNRLFNGTTYDRWRGDTTSGAWVNIKAIAAGTSVIGHVITDTGSVVAATLSAETTKVIGVVRAADGSGNLLTSTTNALDINIKSGSIANTSFGATQTTAANLNATVVGTGTFVVQATLAAETTKVIGTVNQGTSPWAVSLAAETTKVIGVVRNSDGAGNLLTSNSTTPSGKFSLDTNITSILGTAPTTVGKLDIKSADGDTFVRSNAASTFPTQATLQTQTDTVMVGGVNIKEINAVTPLMGAGNGGTGSLRVNIASDQVSIPVAATLAAETTKVIGTVNQGTSPWIVAGGGTAGSAATGVVTVQGIASMTKLLVTPDSVALPANQSVNLAQVGGTNTVTGGVNGSQSVGPDDARRTDYWSWPAVY